MPIIWTAFISFVIIMLALDLGVFHRKSKEVSTGEALAWSGVWISLGLLFSIFIYHGYENHWFGLGAGIDPVDGLIRDGRSATLKYLTGYVVEKSLSVDNVFVIAMIFGFFAVPGIYQHRVLFWGVLGALLLRGLMIGFGSLLIAKFHWVLYLFGVFLIITAVRMFFMKETGGDLGRNPVLRWVRRIFPVTEKYHGEHFIVRAGTDASRESEVPGAPQTADSVVAAAKKGSLLLTPLALALIMVETTDMIFAVDSIPAIFAITTDPFLVFTSNVFAILGLRSLYFALAGMLAKFRYLKPALALVLLVVGVKMLTAVWLKQIFGQAFNFYLLGLILAILAGGVVISLATGSAAPEHNRHRE
ncbi:MAG: TerC/Alx family metal homeostasis membrane protein [Spirochaetes bacterium]|nr:TerC/Alx family metal homeostasis membrane protein [Spirochaetota bacterium]